MIADILRRSLPSTYPYFEVNHDFQSTYEFGSLTATFIVINSDESATNIGCISAAITPSLGGSLSAILTYIPVVVLIAVAFATAFAGIYSPWGTTDPFRWTSNYGRDADLLRLVTPGFGDCLQYIQFVALTGGLTLIYPGYYQPAVSKVAWSALMFNESFVSAEDGYQSLVDGIYVTNGQYGLNDLSQLVGLVSVPDIWAGMVIWLLVILGAIMGIIQLGFLIRFLHRRYTGTQEEDLRAKNMPFSVGNVIRIVFSYFLLPIVALSMFQLVEASKSPAYTVALAAVLLLIVVVFAAWLLYVIASTRPRSYLFDDLPTVLLYGSLYNTYSDNAAPFALIPVLLTFVRGIAIGALTPSGIAQLVVLAICEVITILTLHAFRPFHSPTSMNAYHTVFAACRFISVLLMVAFAPSLGVTDGPKGWIGYAILILHAAVLIFGFMLNALQTMVEVAARLAGAGGDESGAARGGLVKVFGMRQLSRRLPRGDVTASRQSQLSTSAMLDSEQKSAYVADGRLRSQSAASNGMLLNRPHSMGLDSIAPSAITPGTPGEASMFSFLPATAAPAGNRRSILNLSNTEPTSDPYYRPPRPRRTTGEGLSPAARSRGSWASGDWGKSGAAIDVALPEDSGDVGPSVSGRNTPAGPSQAYDPAALETKRSTQDYTTREVDFYYGVRGPALNANVPGRRLRTGPVDPTNNIATIGGFFRGLLGGKTKEKGKGFEVVRSSRMPPGMKARQVAGDESPPEGIPVAANIARNGPIDSDDDEPNMATLPRGSLLGSRNNSSTHQQLPRLVAADGTGTFPSDSSDAEADEFEMTRISDVPPTLPTLDTDFGTGLGVPSRIGTQKSSVSRVSEAERIRRQGSGPNVPRKSSKRASKNVSMTPSEVQAMMNPTYGGTFTDELLSPVSPIELRGENASYYDPPPSQQQTAVKANPSFTFPQSSTHRQTASNGSTRLPFTNEDGHLDRSNTDASKRVSTISTRSSILPNSSDVNDSSQTYDVPRNLSSVRSHGVSRSITTVYPGMGGMSADGVDLLGSEAEIVDLSGVGEDDLREELRRRSQGPF